MRAGKVVSLWRYPVKSMLGEEVRASVVTERGLQGDRAYAILDRETGFIASAKHPRKWSRLLECRAAFTEPPRFGEPLPPIQITLPGDSRIDSTQPDVNDILSGFLGREVALVRETSETPMREADRTPVDGSPGEVIRQEEMALAAHAGSFFDYAPLHLLTTATLNRLRELYPAGRFEPSRFRPNIVIAPLEAGVGFVENAWLGRSVRLGKEVRLQMIDPCPRCVITTLPQEDLPRDPHILRTIAQHNSVASVTLAPGVVLPAVAGVYAAVLGVGTLSQGDIVCLE